MKQNSKPYLILIATVVCGSIIFPTSASALSEAQTGAISTNCDSIKQSLNRLASSDASVRVSLGSIYENLLTNFMSPLNVRLAKNNIPSPTLSDIQVNFNSTRNQFSSNYTAYMKQLEALTNIDCKKSPESFYSALETTRSTRATLQASVLELSSLAHKHVLNVIELKDAI